MPSQLDSFYERSAYLKFLLNSNPAEAVTQAREINLKLETNGRFNLMVLRAATLVDGGALTHQQDAIAVSYTHLDVYKRQDDGRLQCGGRDASRALGRRRFQ